MERIIKEITKEPIKKFPQGRDSQYIKPGIMLMSNKVSLIERKCQWLSKSNIIYVKNS